MSASTGHSASLLEMTGIASSVRRWWDLRAIIVELSQGA